MLKQGISHLFSSSVTFLKDIDPKGRTVQFYGSSFGSVDSDGDVVVKGAFAKTFAENGPKGANRIRHLRQHETRTMIGKIMELGEDDKGAIITSVLLDTTEGNDALALYEADLFEHSFGYRAAQEWLDPATGINYLKELIVREFSSCTWGANADTPLVGMKCDTKAALQHSLERVASRHDKLVKALRHGTISDQLGQQLADELEAIQSAYKGLISLNGQPLQPAPATAGAGEPSGNEALIKSFSQHFK